MTNHVVDFKNADAILVCGNNPAENHPLAMRWIVEAMEKRGAPLIVVDPRFNRTASMATHFLRIRPGTDIAFFGGMIHRILASGRFPREYVTEYTNASFLISPSYKGPDELDGVFPGLTVELTDGTKIQVSNGGVAKQVDWSKVKGGKYDKKDWTYESGKFPAPGPDGQVDAAALAAAVKAMDDAAAAATAEGGKVEAWGNVLVDKTLAHPRSVFQTMLRHYARYTPEKVSEITGAPVDELEKIWDLYIDAAGPKDKAGVILYAMGQTQSTVGVQKIRSLAIMQLLLGNIGVAGGGIAAMRGHSQVQGATDMGILFGNLPGYLKPPTAAQQDWATYVKETTPARIGHEKESLNWWGNTPKYATSLWKAWWRDAFDPTTGAGYEYMPKLDARSYTMMDFFHEARKGNIEGVFLCGMNPAGSMPNTKLVREGMRKLKWMVVSDFYETESACIWQSASDEGIDPKDVDTEVFLLPAASSYEKEGSFSNTGRWIQWRDKAVEPYGDAMSDGHIVNHLFWEIRELYEHDGGVYPDPIVKLDWSYTKEGPFVRNTTKTEEFDTEAIAREINGYALADLEDAKTGATIKAGAQLPGFAWYRDDGSVAGGCWIYAGYYGPKGNTARKRELDDPTGQGHYPNWSWVWPMNRRVLYNRAGVDPKGQPWSPDHASTRWDPDAVNAPNPNGTPVPNGKWVGDVPDGGGAPGAIKPFIMRAEGVARLWGNGTADAALPEHYEPYESQVKNTFSSVQANPCVKRFDTIDPEFTKVARFGTADAEKFPYVMNTIRLTEHFLSGSSTRNARMLAQLQPELFVELSPELAKLERLEENDLVVVESRRARIVARVKVTPRQRPLTVAGKTLHVVGMPFHWGYKGFVTGGTTNDHLHDLGDPNTGIQEDKHLLVKLDRPTASDMAWYRQVLAESQYRNPRIQAAELARTGAKEG